jgi:SOS response regulatory protein OraA/RecX
MGNKSYRKRNNKATIDCLKDIKYIPDDRVGEVLLEAARLQSEANKSYSLADLKQICSEAGISPNFVEKAVRKIEKKRKKQRRRKKYIKKTIRLVIPAITVSILFLCGIMLVLEL